jgi:hypothetical protein
MSNDEQDLTWKINNIREEISLDLKKLASKDLPAEQRKAIREHLQICNSSLKILKDLVERSRDASHASHLRMTTAQ